MEPAIGSYREPRIESYREPPTGSYREPHQGSYRNGPGDSPVHDDLVNPKPDKQKKPLKTHEKVYKFMHNRWVHLVIVAFVILDASLVIASILIDMDVIRDPDKNGKLVEHNGTYSCEKEEHGETLHHVAEGLHVASLVILSLFMCEVLVNIYAQREHFFRSKLHMFDAFIVAFSLAFDVAVLVVKKSTVLDLLGLIVFVRLWRIVRIVEITVVASTDKIEEEKAAESEKREEAERELAEAQKKTVDVNMKLTKCLDQYQVLRARLAKYEHVDNLPGDVTAVPPYLPDTDEIPRQVFGEETADESEDDALSVRPSKQRSGNTYTVNRDGVQNTAV